jgi:predicted aldo/keto reductase-like oxidoreductase
MVIISRRNKFHDKVREAFDASLEALGLDYLDLYLMHWPQASTIDHRGLGFQSFVRMAVSNSHDHLSLTRGFSATRTKPHVHRNMERYGKTITNRYTPIIIPI